jgi:hypothetical protein
MAEPPKYRVGPPRSAAASPAAAIGGILAFIGLWLLFMGVSEYYGGASTQNMYRGTVLERDADANRITGNAISAGVTKIGFGIVVLLVGGVVARTAKKSSAIDVPTDSAAQTPRSRPMLERVLIGVAIFFGLLLGIPLLLVIFGVIR